MKKRKLVFLSFCFDDKAFVDKVNAFLTGQPELTTYFYPKEKTGQGFSHAIEAHLARADAFVLFVGARLGDTETAEALKAQESKMESLIVVRLPTAKRGGLAELLPVDLHQFVRRDPVVVKDIGAAEKCDREIVGRMGLRWDVLGIPETYPFEYEKDIVRTYMRGNGRASPELVAQGCPGEWPDVDRRPGNRENPVPETAIGDYRDCHEDGSCGRDPRVIVAALSVYHNPDGHGCPLAKGLSFAEAGPRKQHVFPQQGSDLRVGILVSGGIAPGLNAVIAGIISRHILYFDALKSDVGRLTFHCYREGFNSRVSC